MADDAATPEGAVSESAEQTADGKTEATETSEASTTTDATAVEDGEDIDAVESDTATDIGAAAPQRSHVTLALIAGLVLVLALGGLTGWLGFRAFQSKQLDDQRKVFLQVGRQGAINLTSIDFEHADADVQRILDSATGTFYDDFQKRAGPFVEVVKQAKSKSIGTVTEAGLESDTDTGAQVLVAVTVQTSNAGAAEQQPRLWRMRITVQKMGDDVKVSNVEFVP
ncbi:Mce protein [Mycolicibacterium sp. 120266]|uniref:Mce protein n=1 Tax=Mycolicibacterium sp. 120266 TaxID=3090601 RepID=UPI00299DCEC8|nr:Mce protein [Mycolicibacterium sp. 120266]MDX1875285.1 Mce protein [Mycolicibacterium sp. 120266]